MSARRGGRFLSPPKWTPEQFATDLEAAEEIFRRERLEEPLEEYLGYFETVQGILETSLFSSSWSARSSRSIH